MLPVYNLLHYIDKCVSEKPPKTVSVVKRKTHLVYQPILNYASNKYVGGLYATHELAEVAHLVMLTDHLLGYATIYHRKYKNQQVSTDITARLEILSSMVQ